jgi:hypothetical protein
VFVSDGDEGFGAVRQIAPHGRPELVIYVENAGDFVVPLAAIEAVHSQKVILNCSKLEPRLREAIGHALRGWVRAEDALGKDQRDRPRHVGNRHRGPFVAAGKSESPVAET